MSFYSGKDNKYIVRNAFPLHIMMDNFRVENKFVRNIDDREYWDNINEDSKEYYLKKAEGYLDFVWRSIPACNTYLGYFEGIPHTRDNVIFEKRDALMSLLLGECIENKGRFIRQIIDGIFSICEQTTWAPASHFMICAENKEKFPDPDDPVLDIYETSQAAYLSHIYATLGNRLDEISPVVCQRIKREVRKRVIDPYLERDDLWWMGFETDLTFWRLNNWTTSANTSVMYAALALKEDRKTVFKVINKAIECFDNLVDIYPDDGSCEEGPGYWHSAVLGLVDAFELIDHAMYGKGKIFEKKKIRSMFEYILNMRIDKNIYASIADSHPLEDIQFYNILPLYNIGKILGDDRYINEAYELMEFIGGNSREYLTPTTGVYHEFLYYDELTKNKIEAKKQIRKGWMPGVQIMSVHEKENSGEGLYLFAKGGHNGESHNHNDLGSFIVYKDGAPVIIDAGIGLYTKDTFGENRYKNWWANGFYHNVPVIDGVAQMEGIEYFAENAVCEFSDEKDFMSVELKNAYPNSDKIKTVCRELTLDRNKNAVTISDKYEFLEAMTYETVLLVHKKPVVLDDTIKIGEATVKIEGEAPYEVLVEEIKIEDSLFFEMWGEYLYRVVVKVNALPSGNLNLVIN